MDITIPDVDIVLEKTVKNGRIFGLRKYEGRKVKLVILNERLEGKK